MAYVGTHLLLCIGYLILFSLAMTYKVFYRIILDDSPTFFQNYPAKRYYRNPEGAIFSSFLALDIIFCLGSSVLVAFLVRRFFRNSSDVDRESDLQKPPMVDSRETLHVGYHAKK